MSRFILLLIIASLTTACSSPSAPDAGDEVVNGSEPSETIGASDADDGPDMEARVADSTTEASPPDMHTSQNALDWPGTYEGVLPCADCEGILTTLTIAADGRYVLSRAWLGRGDAVLTEEGGFTWTEDGRNVVLDDQDQEAYKVGESRIWVLDADMKRVEGDLADRYVLEKVAE